MVYICHEEAMFKIWLKSVEFGGIKTFSKIDGIAGIITGVIDDYRHSYKDWCL